MLEKKSSITQNIQRSKEYDTSTKHLPSIGIVDRINSEQYPPLKEKLRTISRQVAERNRQLYKELENV